LPGIVLNPGQKTLLAEIETETGEAMEKFVIIVTQFAGIYQETVLRKERVLEIEIGTEIGTEEEIQETEEILEIKIEEGIREIEIGGETPTGTETQGEGVPEKGGRTEIETDPKKYVIIVILCAGILREIVQSQGRRTIEEEEEIEAEAGTEGGGVTARALVEAEIRERTRAEVEAGVMNQIVIQEEVGKMIEREARVLVTLTKIKRETIEKRAVKIRKKVKAHPVVSLNLGRIGAKVADRGQYRKMITREEEQNRRIKDKLFSC